MMRRPMWHIEILPGVRRRLFTILSALSLLLCLATAVLWVRCNERFYTSHVSSLTNGPARWEIVYIRDSFVVRKSLKLFKPPPTTLPKGAVWAGISQATVYAQLSYWELLAFFAVLPAFWVVRYMRDRRKLMRSNRGACPSCDYDLRATPDRCPECGTIPASQTSN
jgi:hypothetical protein